MEWIIGIIILLVIVGMFSKPTSCDVCGLEFKKKYFEWTIDGKKQFLCPKCNTQMENTVSRDSFRGRFG